MSEDTVRDVQMMVHMYPRSDISLRTDGHADGCGYGGRSRNWVLFWTAGGFQSRSSSKGVHWAANPVKIGGLS